MGYYLRYFLGKVLLGAGIAALVLYPVQAANAPSVSVTLTWDANPEPDIAGYRLYYGTASGTYTAQVDVGNVTTATVSNLRGRTVYFFALTASNTSGFESLFSNEVEHDTSSPTPTPSPAATSTPIPTATPNPSASPLIIVLPTIVNFTAVAGGNAPAPQSIQVTTSNNASWNSFDTSPWYNAQPTSGASGTSTILTPHIEGLPAGTYSNNITFSAAGHANTVVAVNLTLIAPPSPTPISTPTPIPTPTPTSAVRDDFSRSNGDLGPNWTKDPAWGNGLAISDKQVVGANSGVHYWNASTFAADQYSQIRLTGVVGSWSGVFVRGSLRPGPYYMVAVRPDGADLYSSSNGTFSQLAHDGTGWATGDVLKLAVQTVDQSTARLTVYRNGVELFSYDDTEPFIESGQPGIGLHDATGNMSLDDWEGGEIQ